LVVYDRRALDFVHAAMIARHAQPEQMTMLEILGILLKALFIKRLGLTAVLMTGGPYPGIL